MQRGNSIAGSIYRSNAFQCILSANSAVDIFWLKVKKPPTSRNRKRFWKQLCSSASTTRRHRRHRRNKNLQQLLAKFRKSIPIKLAWTWIIPLSCDAFHTFAEQASAILFFFFRYPVHQIFHPAWRMRDFSQNRNHSGNKNILEPLLAS